MKDTRDPSGLRHSQPTLSRPENAPSWYEPGRMGFNKHVIGRIRRNWPQVEIMVRGDGHHGNARLKGIGQSWCEDVAVRRAQRGKDKLRRFFQTGYQAKSRSRERKVIARLEATPKGCDIRFVVTNLPGRARVLYEKIYCARGRMENMIKDSSPLPVASPHPDHDPGGKSRQMNPERQSLTPLKISL